METVCCCCRWLRWMSLILLLPYCQGLPRHPCAQGQLLQTSARSKFLTCCYPTRCGVGEEVIPCTANGMHDVCNTCKQNQNQSLRTSSFTMERCMDWPLNEFCRSTDYPDKPRNILDEQTKRCMCNIEQGQKFQLPELDLSNAPMESYCQKMDGECKPGFEPQVDGGCRPCNENYFKSVRGYMLCEPKTICTLLGLNYTFLSDATADNICSKPEPFVTIKPAITHRYVVTAAPKTSPEVSSQPSSTSTATTWSPEAIHFDTSLGPPLATKTDMIWPIVGSVLALIAVAACIVLGIYCCNWRRVPVHVCVSATDRADEEANHEQGTRSLYRGPQVKHTVGNGRTVPRNIINGNKIASNGLHSGTEDLPNGHFSIMENGSDGSLQHSYHPAITTRPSNLGTGRGNIIFDQSHGHLPDLIGRDKLRVHFSELEANPDVDETDSFLVSDDLQGASYDQIANFAASPVQQILAGNSSELTNRGHIFAKNGPRSPAVTYKPTADTVLFIRSTSLIASPEEEVEAEDLAKYPRFSQLFQDEEDASVTDSAHDSLDVNPSDQHPADIPPPPLKPISEREIQTVQPDHHIMKLKGHELAESLQSSPSSTSPVTQLKTSAGFTATSCLNHATSKEAQQTRLKTAINSTTDNLSNISATDKAKTNNSVHLFKDMRHKHSENEGITHNLADRKRNTGNGRYGQNNLEERLTDVRNLSDRNCVPNERVRGHNTLEHYHAPAGDLHKSCIHNYATDESDGASEKCKNYHPVVSIEEFEKPPGNKQCVKKTDPKSLGPSETMSTGFRYNVPLRSVSDPEQTNFAQANSDPDKTEAKYVSHKSTTSSTSSKTSVNSDISVANDGHPSKNTLYRRSQSQTAPSSSESSHKPPPRSMSEEKSQKMDRPVAKVKPMPASDNSVNQLPVEALDIVALAQQQSSAHAVTANISTTAMLDSSSDESGDEYDRDSNQHPTPTM